MRGKSRQRNGTWFLGICGRRLRRWSHLRQDRLHRGVGTDHGVMHGFLGSIKCLTGLLHPLFQRGILLDRLVMSGLDLGLFRIAQVAHGPAYGSGGSRRGRHRGSRQGGWRWRDGIGGRNRRLLSAKADEGKEGEREMEGGHLHGCDGNNTAVGGKVAPGNRGSIKAPPAWRAGRKDAGGDGRPLHHPEPGDQS